MQTRHFPRELFATMLSAIVLLAPWCLAADEPFDPAGIKGSLFLVGGGPFPARLRGEFVRLADAGQGTLVVIPTAGERAGEAEYQEQVVSAWKSLFQKVEILHVPTAEEVSDEHGQQIALASAVWFEGGDQSRIAEAYVGTVVERELLALLARGGVIGGTSAGAAIQSRLMIARGNPAAELGTGLDLLPDAVVDQHFLKRERQPRLRRVLAEHPGHFGVGIDEGTALIVRGRLLRVLGESTVTICLSEGGGRPAREYTLRNGEVDDLTGLRRAARDRANEPFPSRPAAVPEVPQGSLMIVGGGGMPRPLVDRFIELAGGPDEPLVVLPTANPDPLPGDDAPLTRLFTSAGAKRVTVLRARTREEVESPETLDALRGAKGVWFGGGRQWRFVDCYAGTAAEPLLHDVLRRGGVIGGSSAGASIQAEYLVRGSPLGNTIMMADGYERGLGFLPGVGIDQHFRQRNRFGDLASVIAVHPQLLGIGIDEATALLVHGDQGEVLGQGEVHFFDGTIPALPGEPEYASVGVGGLYDLRRRTVLRW